MPRSTEQIRLLTSNDLSLVSRLLQTSEYVYQRFTQEELPTILSHYPALGIISGPTLRGFLLSQTVNPPTAWIGGFCVTWTESKAYLKHLTTLLNALAPLLIDRGVRYLHYSGNDIENDWLRAVLLTMNFHHTALSMPTTNTIMLFPHEATSRSRFAALRSVISLHYSTLMPLASRTSGAMMPSLFVTLPLPIPISSSRNSTAT